MSETCQKLVFTHPVVVLKSGLKNNWMKKLDRVNWPQAHVALAKSFLEQFKVDGIQPMAPVQTWRPTRRFATVKY